MVLSTTWLLTFLSTPSARRATGHGSLAGDRMDISIHARREEGDTASPVKLTKQKIFLSTPSARRATDGGGQQGHLRLFLSTPSARRATRQP